MWFGILIGFLISLLITMILLNKNNYFVATTIIIISTIFSALLGIYVNNINYIKYINSYIAKKEVIERSINNNNLSNLEKIEIVKQILELNGELAEKKTEYNQKLLYFYLNTNKINKLKEIEIVEE